MEAFKQRSNEVSVFEGARVDAERELIIEVQVR